MQYDYYKILEIPRNASLEDIKKAYRVKAKLVHPDVNDSPKANEVFLVVSAAYDVLCDENKRYLHDLKLNYFDSERVSAEKKRQYYGSSVRNDSFSNPGNANFDYNWNNFNNFTYKEKTEEDYYKSSPWMYNIFFCTGMFIGFVIIYTMIDGTIHHFWPLPFGLISILGFIIVWEGFKGMIGKKSAIGSILNKFRR